MDALLNLINAGANGLIALVLIGAILSPKVLDGVIVKAGLICMVLGFGAVAFLLLDGMTARDMLGIERALMLTSGGITIVIIGYLLRRCRSKNQSRRRSDWIAREQKP